MKHFLAGAVTLALIAGVLLLGRRKQDTSAAADATPENCVEQMLAAADRGDVDAYLDFFTGSQREQIERDLAQQTREGFARSLAEAQREMKGRSVQLAAADPNAAAAPPSDTAEVTVERIYAHHNQRQTYLLRRTSAGWKIEDLRGAVNFQPPVPYGTPVWEESAFLSPGTPAPGIPREGQE
jgi:hypothetical protein